MIGFSRGGFQATDLSFIIREDQDIYYLFRKNSSRRSATVLRSADDQIGRNAISGASHGERRADGDRAPVCKVAFLDMTKRNRWKCSTEPRAVRLTARRVPMSCTCRCLHRRHSIAAYRRFPLPRGSASAEQSSSSYPIKSMRSVVMAFPTGLAAPRETPERGPCCVADVDDVAFTRKSFRQRDIAISIDSFIKNITHWQHAWMQPIAILFDDPPRLRLPLTRRYASTIKRGKLIDLGNIPGRNH